MRPLQILILPEPRAPRSGHQIAPVEFPPEDNERLDSEGAVVFPRALPADAEAGRGETCSTGWHGRTDP